MSAPSNEEHPWRQGNETDGQSGNLGLCARRVPARPRSRLAQRVLSTRHAVRCFVDGQKIRTGPPLNQKIRRSLPAFLRGLTSRKLMTGERAQAGEIEFWSA
jgi:hypothetical protein